jgi:ribosomal protein S18 acetylase RimI-like enzyme
VAASIAAGFASDERVGPFAVHFDAHSANLFRNYALPDAGAAPTPLEIDALIALFDQHDRTPRLEYLPDIAPEVEPALVAAGFAVEFRSPVFGCRRGEATDLGAPDGIVFALVTEDADLVDVARVQNAAYGEPAPPGPADVARLRRLVARGGIVALARAVDNGEPAGAGLCEAATHGVSELAAVGVAEAYRRRGIASALTAFLARSMHDRDIESAHGADLVWLEREQHLPDRLYERAGFTRGAEKLWISRPAT